MQKIDSTCAWSNARSSTLTTGDGTVLQEDFSLITPSCLTDFPLSCGIEKATFGFLIKNFDFLGDCGNISFVVYLFSWKYISKGGLFAIVILLQ